MAQNSGIQVHCVASIIRTWRNACNACNTVSCGAERAIADLIRERKAGTADAQLMQDAIGGTFEGIAEGPCMAD